MAKKASVTLPLIESTQPARDALALMRKYKRSGVLSFRAGHWWLYEAAGVVIAVSADPGAPLRSVRAIRIDAGVTKRGAAVASVTASASAVRDRAPRRGVELTGRTGGRGLTAARLGALAAGPFDCYCIKDRKPVPGGRTGGDCPDGHRGSVNCVPSS